MAQHYGATSRNDTQVGMVGVGVPVDLGSVWNLIWDLQGIKEFRAEGDGLDSKG